MKSTSWILAAAIATGCGGGGTAQQPAPSALSASFTSGNAQLAYTLDRPSGPGPFPAVVLGHGSGQVTRGQLT